MGLRALRFAPRLATLLVLAVFAAGAAALAAPTFPALSGRVVDGAGLLPADTRTALDVLEHFGEVDSIALAARKNAHLRG